jgi:hypothetical protein
MEFAPGDKGSLDAWCRGAMESPVLTPDDETQLAHGSRWLTPKRATAWSGRTCAWWSRLHGGTRATARRSCGSCKQAQGYCTPWTPSTPQAASDSRNIPPDIDHASTCAVLGNGGRERWRLRCHVTTVRTGRMLFVSPIENLTLHPSAPFDESTRGTALNRATIMAKLKTDPITASDIEAYLKTESDFDFELSVLKLLGGHGFHNEHAGTYVDESTGKSRQFDIRSLIASEPFVIRLAVECKNLKEYYPLVVSRVPRMETESYHDVICAFSHERLGLTSREWISTSTFSRPIMRQAVTARVWREQSIYGSGEFVGKATDQVGRLAAAQSTWASDDREVYEKWSQAISSAADVTAHCAHLCDMGALPAYCAFVLPVLVVPDGRLWAVDYDADGKMVRGPHQVQRCSYYISKWYLAGDKMTGTGYMISHIEFVTVTGLASLADWLRQQLEQHDDTSVSLFPRRTIADQMYERLSDLGFESPNAKAKLLTLLSGDDNGRALGPRA